MKDAEKMKMTASAFSSNLLIYSLISTLADYHTLCLLSTNTYDRKESSPRRQGGGDGGIIITKTKKIWAGIAVVRRA